MAGVDTHQRHVEVAGDLAGAQDRAVASQDEDEVSAGGTQADGLDAVGTQGGAHPLTDERGGAGAAGGGHRLVVVLTLDDEYTTKAGRGCGGHGFLRS